MRPARGPLPRLETGQGRRETRGTTTLLPVRTVGPRRLSCPPPPSPPGPRHPTINHASSPYQYAGGRRGTVAAAGGRQGPPQTPRGLPAGVPLPPAPARWWRPPPALARARQRRPPGVGQGARSPCIGRSKGLRRRGVGARPVGAVKEPPRRQPPPAAAAAAAAAVATAGPGWRQGQPPPGAHRLPRACAAAGGKGRDRPRGTHTAAGVGGREGERPLTQRAPWRLGWTRCAAPLPPPDCLSRLCQRRRCGDAAGLAWRPCVLQRAGSLSDRGRRLRQSTAFRIWLVLLYLPGFHTITLFSILCRLVYIYIQLSGQQVEITMSACEVFTFANELSVLRPRSAGRHGSQGAPARLSLTHTSVTLSPFLPPPPR